MAAFLVERYWPGVTAESVATAESAVALAGAAGVGPSRTVIIETIVSSQDEVCLWYVEAETQEAVAQSFAAAGIPVDRIGPVTRRQHRGRR